MTPPEISALLCRVRVAEGHLLDALGQADPAQEVQHIQAARDHLVAIRLALIDARQEAEQLVAVMESLPVVVALPRQRPTLVVDNRGVPGGCA